MRKRFWVEVGLAAVTAALAELTLVTREWIELLTGWDPDQGNGTLEWAIVATPAVLSMVAFLLARAEWRAARPAPA